MSTPVSGVQANAKRAVHAAPLCVRHGHKYGLLLLQLPSGMLVPGVHDHDYERTATISQGSIDRPVQ